MAYSVTQTCLFSEENIFNSCYLMVVKIVSNALAMMISNGLLNIHFRQELSKNGTSSELSQLIPYRF